MEQAWPSVAAVLQRWWPGAAFLADNAERFPINGQWMWYFAMTSAATVYLIV